MIIDHNFKSIQLEDKKVLSSFFKEQNVDASEYSFTNLFSWSRSREIKFQVIRGTLFLCACYEDDHYLLQPFNSPDYNRDLADMLEALKSKGILYAKRIGQSIAKTLDPALFIIEEDRDNFDYIYDGPGLARLAGRKYSNKRAFVKKFKEKYTSYSYEPYTPRLFDQVLELTEIWLERKKETNDSSMYNEYEAIRFFLDNFESLDALGAVLMVEGKAAAFAFGEILSKNTFVIHFEKADTRFTGVYQTINQLFIQNEVCDKFEFVNREQDIGIEGIRKAKLSYQPIKMGKKYTVRLR